MNVPGVPRLPPNVSMTNVDCKLSHAPLWGHKQVLYRVSTRCRVSVSLPGKLSLPRDRPSDRAPSRSRRKGRYLWRRRLRETGRTPPASSRCQSETGPACSEPRPPAVRVTAQGGAFLEVTAEGGGEARQLSRWSGFGWHPRRSRPDRVAAHSVRDVVCSPRPFQGGRNAVSVCWRVLFRDTAGRLSSRSVS